MPLPDTSMGGSREAFPETSWSAILEHPDPNHPRRRERLDRLIQQYWRPVYRYIRASWGAPVEDSKDLAQAFFCHLLESDLVLKYEAERGRFRHFLKGALKLFLAEAHRDQGRLKRGGGKQIVSLDVGPLEGERVVGEKRPSTPDDLFDRQWKRDLLSRAIGEAQRRLASEGKEPYYRVFEAYELPPGEKPTYGEVAGRLGLTPYDVKNYLDHVRRLLEEILREIIADTVATPDELADEMRDLFHG